MARVEHDLIGELELPDSALYGIQTERTRLNFNAAGRPVHFQLIRALTQVKLACALANRDCGFLDSDLAAAIAGACEANRQGTPMRSEVKTDSSRPVKRGKKVLLASQDSPGNGGRR